MIAYQFTGRGTRTLPPALLTRLAREMRKIPGGSGKRTIRIGVRFVTEQEIRRLNRAFRKQNRATDVLSFSQREGGFFPRPDASEDDWGDVVIAPSVASREARRHAIQPREELVRLIVHGTLHLAGMDHAIPRDEARMFGLQERLVGQVLRDRAS